MWLTIAVNKLQGAFYLFMFFSPKKNLHLTGT
jgi:hypothetical protein